MNVEEGNFLDSSLTHHRKQKIDFNNWASIFLHISNTCMFQLSFSGCSSLAKTQNNILIIFLKTLFSSEYIEIWVSSLQFLTDFYISHWLWWQCHQWGQTNHLETSYKSLSILTYTTETLRRKRFNMSSWMLKLSSCDINEDLNDLINLDQSYSWTIEISSWSSITWIVNSAKWHEQNNVCICLQWIWWSRNSGKHK